MKTIIKIFICLSLIYTPFFAFAGAAENWEIVTNTYDQERNRVNIEARKITQDAANSGRYKVEVPVSPSALGKTVKTMMWTGLAVAGVEAMLQGIGWVIDYGSQVIKRPLPADPPCYDVSCLPPTAIKGYQHAGGNLVGIIYSTGEAACSAYNSAHGNGWWGGTRFNGSNACIGIQSGTNISPLIVIPNPNYNPDAPPPPPKPEFEILSDAELGNEIIGNGENTQPLPDAVEEAYSPNNPTTEPAPEASRRALDNANPQPETEPTGETKPKPNTDTDGDGEPDAYDPAQPDQGTEFQLPNFCSWAPAVCDFFTVQKADNKDIKNNQREQIEQDKTFFEKVAEWFDWSQTDDELPDNESPEIVEHVTPDLKEDAISWVASCPADEHVPISLQGVTSTLVLSWSPWCQLLDVIKPAIIASAYIGAAFIVLGIRT